MGERLRGRADGFLILSPWNESIPVLRRLRENGMAFLSLGSSWLGEDLPAVDSDNISGAAQAVDYLIGLGHQRIGLIGAPEMLSNSADRHAGFRRALARHGIDYRGAWFMASATGGPLTDSDKAHLVELVRQPGGPTAVVSVGYELAVDAIKAFQNSGLSVPENVSVVGFDDTFTAAFLTPPLTTVVQPLQEMGRRAALRLDAILRGSDDSPVIERFPVRLVVRGSCAPPRQR
jgi:LacI family transcriptional regulator